MVDDANAAPTALYQSDALEGVRQQRIARVWRSNQHIAGRDAKYKPARIADHYFIVMKLDMDGAQPGVIAVDQGVVDRFAHAARIITRHADACTADHQLLLFIAHLNGLHQPFLGAQQRPAAELVHFHIAAMQHLEGNLVRGQIFPQNGLFACHQQPGQRGAQPGEGGAGLQCLSGR